ASDLKIAEGESPRPVTRVFYKFNFYSKIDEFRFRDPSQPLHNIDLYRQVVGFEYALFDNRASFGLRVPVNTLTGDGKTDANGVRGPDETTTDFGNVSAIAKAVLWEDRASGSLLSGGATVSFPTASSPKINPAQSTIAYLQPFVAFLWSNGDFFV